MTKVILIAAILAAAFFFPRIAARPLRRIENVLGRVAKRATIAIAASGLLAFAIAAGITLIIGPSPPHVHDEFANLLAADTFAKGRLTNEPHPLWEHFEEIHILSHPKHMSKYPPAQGAMLSLGQVLTGKPFIGLWVSAGLAAATICWALLAWVSARWAFLGGLLTATHPVIVKWSQVYWGGLEAVIGGALVIGALRRIVSRTNSIRCATANQSSPRFVDSLLLGVGMGILANSRPFEGFILCSLVMAFLFLWAVSGYAPSLQILITRVGIPVTIALLPVFLFMAYYNVRATGSPTRMAYMAYEEQYAVAPFLVWQKPRAVPEFRHDFIRRHMLDYALEEHQRQQSFAGFLRETKDKYLRLGQNAFWTFRPTYLWLAIVAIPLIAFCRGWTRNAWVRLATIFSCVFFAILLMETWMWDRYAAPAAILVAIIVITAFRQLRVWRPCHRASGLFLSRAIIALCLLYPVPWTIGRAKVYAEKKWYFKREEIITELERTGEKHLIIVRYLPTQPVHDDWVHNSADIDSQQVIWARDMGEKNQRLLDYYKGRKIWILEPHKDPLKPSPLSTAPVP